MHLNKPIVLFDIDYTLFDVGHFDKNFHNYLSDLLGKDKNSVTKTSVKIIVKLIKEEGFLDVDKYLKILLAFFRKEKYVKEVEEFLFGGEFFKKGFYPDVAITLNSLKSLVRLGIFSTGDLKLQESKIKQSGFDHLFEEGLKYIKTNKVGFIPEFQKKHLNDKIFLIEDKLTVLYEMKKQIPDLFAIWIKRGKYAQNQKEIPGFKPDAEVENLSEVVGIVSKKI